MTKCYVNALFFSLTMLYFSIIFLIFAKNLTLWNLLELSIS